MHLSQSVSIQKNWFNFRNNKFTWYRHYSTRKVFSFYQIKVVTIYMDREWTNLFFKTIWIISVCEWMNEWKYPLHSTLEIIFFITSIFFNVQRSSSSSSFHFPTHHLSHLQFNNSQVILHLPIYALHSCNSWIWFFCPFRIWYCTWWCMLLKVNEWDFQWIFQKKKEENSITKPNQTRGTILNVTSHSAPGDITNPQ